MRKRKGHLFKRGRIYHVQWRIDGRLFSKSTGQADRRHAERERESIMAPFAAHQEADILENVKARIEGRRAEKPETPISEAWDKYIRSKSRARRAGSRTLEGYHSHWAEFLQWLEDNHPTINFMERVTPALAERFMDYVEHSYSPTTYNRKLQTLKLLFKTVCPLHQPFSDFEKNPEHQEVREPFTESELQKIRAKATGDMADLIDLAILTAQRLEDLCCLRKDAFDTASQHNGFTRGYLTLEQRKTRKWVNVPAFMIQPLWRLLTRLRDSNETEYYLPALAERFTRDYRDSYVSRQFRRILVDCEIPHWEKRKNGRLTISRKSFHSLRHSFVTVARLCGIQSAVIKSISGHSDQMLEHYTHINPAQIGAFLKATGINGELKDKAKTLPEKAGQPAELSAVPGPHIIDPEPIKQLVASLNARNVRKVKGELLALLTREV